MNIRFSNPELELMYKILVRVKTKYNKSLDSSYNWVDRESLDSLIKRFKFNLNEAFIEEMQKETEDA